MNLPNVITPDCIPTTPPAPDPRCGDPIFALLNPDICASSQFLRIKPGTLLTCLLGSVQFRAFTVLNGIETEVDAVWTSSDPTIALISVSQGNVTATGVGVGPVTITAVAQGMTANASLTVLAGLDCCADNDVATMLVVDKSHSMSLQFGGGYATKQAFADAVASNYAAQTNIQKDKIGLIEFDDTPVVDESPTSDANLVSVEAGAIVNSVKKTGLGLALQKAVDELALISATTKIIVLISDGEDKDTDPDNAPIPIATAFKTAGGIVFTIAVRAHGQGFNLMNAMSTGGFFVSAYPENVTVSLNSIYGLKGYLCAGNCRVPGNSYENEPQLDYTEFQNWDVTGHVDLLGPGLFDLLPGNGLYVSLASNMAPWSGSLTTKEVFTFVAGTTYRLSFYLAGNQRQDLGAQNVTVKVGSGSQFQQTITVPYYGQDFIKYSFSWTPLASENSTIKVSQVGDDSEGNYYGSLFNRFMLEDLTDLTVLFDDDFNTENLQYVTPGCGGGLKISPDVPIVSNVVGGVNDPDAPNVVPSSPVALIPVMTSNTLPSGTASSNSEAFTPAWYGFGGNAHNWVSGSFTVNFLRYQFSSGQVAQILEVNGLTNFNGTVASGTCKLQGSNNGIAWTDIYSFGYSFPTSGIDTNTEVSNVTSYTYYRLLFTTTNTDPIYLHPNGFTGNIFQLFTKAGDMDSLSGGETVPTYEYAISYETAVGETALSPVASADVPDVDPYHGYAMMLGLPGSVDPAVTAVRIWRSEVVGADPARFYLLDSVAPATVTYTDTQSHADFQAILDPLILPPTENTTGSGGAGGSGAMTPGETYSYKISYLTEAGRTPVSAAAEHTVGPGASALRLDFPWTPPTVNTIQVWREETDGMLPARFYLLAELPANTTQYVDTASHGSWAPDVTVFPPSGFSGGYGYFPYYGYSCYGYGCLSEPPGSQTPDLNPLPDIEADYVPPTTYTSTRSFTAQCPDGTIQRASQESINVAGQDAPFVSSSTETGFASSFETVAVNVTPTEDADGNITVLVEGSADGITFVTLLLSNPYLPVADTLAQFQVTLSASYQYYRCTITPQNSAVSAPGTYTFDLLTAPGGTGITSTATETSIISQADADAKALAQATLDANAELATVGCSVQYTSTTSANAKCPVGQYDGNGGQGVTKSATETSFVSQADADALAQASAEAAAAAALSCSNSNNEQGITINDYSGGVTAATPYPSVSFKSGLTGAITRIRVNLINFIHTYPEDVGILLISPLGKKVLLMLNCGGAVPIPSAINLTFDSNSVNPLPDATLIAAGTYQPTQYGVQYPFAAPCPANPYLTDFSTLIGDDPNGAWSLWIVDSKALDTGSVGGGWTLTLDTA